MMIDTKQIDHNGIPVVLTKHWDGDVQPSDFDCYSEEQIEAWKADRWHYVGITAHVEIDGIRFPEANGVWGMEDGDYPGARAWVDAFDSAYVSDVADEAVAMARETAARVLPALAETAAS